MVFSYESFTNLHEFWHHYSIVVKFPEYFFKKNPKRPYYKASILNICGQVC